MKSFDVGDKVKYVRVRNIVRDQFVEFDFAIDDPRLYVELILPKATFKQFCINNSTVEMTEEQCRMVDEDAEKWRYGTDTLAATVRAGDGQQVGSDSTNKTTIPDNVIPLHAKP
jgi:phenol hydroxylase P0 protein